MGKGTRLLRVLLVTLAAFLWHSLLTQTHLHAAPPIAASSLATFGSLARDAGHQAQDSSSDDCAICQELALSGDYLSPAPIGLAAPLAVAMPALAVAVLHPVRSRRSHAWRSRAPPPPGL